MILITSTWAGDLDHFRVMRRSVEMSPLADLPHYVVVQTEDLPLFAEFSERHNLRLISTAEILPADVESKRIRARRISQKMGRNVTRIAGSLRRKLSWPSWPSYTGWHTQQLCKLLMASNADCDAAIVLDSDVLVTPNACPEDFISNDIMCFGSWQDRTKLKGKAKNWIEQSEALVHAQSRSDSVNTYFDTPFVFNTKMLCRMLAYLESRSGKLWWQVLLDRPPRRWSEFGVYKAYLTHHSDSPVRWREPEFCRYIYDTSDPAQIISTVRVMINDPGIHFITIHSQSAGRQTWDAGAYLGALLKIIEGNYHPCDDSRVSASSAVVPMGAALQ